MVKKILDIANNNNLFNVPDEGHTIYDVANYSFDSIYCVLSINTEMDKPSEHYYCTSN